MSRPRSRSPLHPYRPSSLYRRSPACHEDRRYSSDRHQETSEFIPRDPRSAVDHAHWDGWDRTTASRTVPRAELREEYFPEPRRRARSPDQWRGFPPDRPRFSPPVEFEDHRGSPQPSFQLGYAERHRLSPKRRYHTPDGNEGRRAGSRDDHQRFPDDRVRHSPRRFSREGSLVDPYNSASQRRAPSPGWHRGGRSPGSEPTPGHTHSPRPKPGRSAWVEPCDLPRNVPNREAGFSGELHRSPYSERYAEEPAFRERRRSTERLRDVRRPEARSPPWGQRRSPERAGAPVIVEHDHGMGREPASGRRGYDHDCGHGNAHAREGPSERYPRERGPQGRGAASAHQDDATPQRFQGRRSPPLSDRRQGKAPQNYPRPRDSQGFLKQLAPAANGDVDLRRMDPLGDRELGSPPRASAVFKGQQGKQLKKMRYRRRGARPPTPDTPHRAPPHRAPPQETLTIKVDVQRPAAQNSTSCFSSDRQLSLDLVNVGRQRLDFLPMLEHSGANRETTLHSGTFAQEIITLVHQVKENYFKGEGVTLNERFSSVQSGQSEDDGGPSGSPVIHRLINVSQSELKPQPVFKRVGSMQRKRQLADDPCDLRHDLERRRQERLEGVKVTIPGGSFSQRPLLGGSVLSEDEEGDEEGSCGQSWAAEGVESAAEQWGGEPGRAGRKRPAFVRQGAGARGKSRRQQVHPKQQRQQRPSSQRESGGSW
ncbi:BCLAF1 and THRAP3 family member 3 isoform X2 [Megalops cyprinoides]|uniref:BCLAF1 and THRAP3 family member 3 isoform X2 n=1 Tax=Megalops cyprinoides TaxID=118141 RepID=UPI001864BB8E|nr:BCLAF1 and THRAP3 family member 3 isoform X2 [Megalops cyprinoides]